MTSPLSKNLSDNSCRINRILAKFLASVTPAEAQSTALIGSLTGGGNRFHFHSYSTTFQKTALRRDRRKPIFSSHVIGMPPNRSEIRRGEAPSRGVLRESSPRPETAYFKVQWSGAMRLISSTRLAVFSGEHELSCPIRSDFSGNQRSTWLQHTLWCVYILENVSIADV